jgi:hypothetical protein
MGGAIPRSRLRQIAEDGVVLAAAISERGQDLHGGESQ